MKSTAEVRRIFNDSIWSAPIILVPNDPPKWITASFGMGPFPARVILVERERIALAHVALLKYPDMAVGRAILSPDSGLAPNFPMPGVWQRLSDGAFFVEFKLAYDRATIDEAVGMLCSCALFVAALTKSVFAQLDEDRQRHLQRFGFNSTGDFVGDRKVQRRLSMINRQTSQPSRDPREMLFAEVQEYDDWDRGNH